MATTGLHGTGRYASPWDAGQAGIATANAGLSLTDVLSRLAGGVWPGLAGFYARYQHGHRTAAVRADWRKAACYLAKHPQRPGSEHVRISPTSEPPHTPRG